MVNLTPATFTDTDVQDTHTASVDCGDGSPVEAGAVDESDGFGSVSGAHTYVTAGVYTGEVCVSDEHGASGCDSFEVHCAAIVNDVLSMTGYATAYDPKPVPGAPARVYTIAVLTRNNLVLNADGGPAGVGATVTVPSEALGENGVLDPGEPFTIDFRIGLKVPRPFAFFVDAYGILAGNGAYRSELGERGDSFRFRIDEEQLRRLLPHRLYLPIVMVR